MKKRKKSTRSVGKVDIIGLSSYFPRST